MGDLQTHVTDGPRPVLCEPGRTGEQFERRDGVGPLPITVCGSWAFTGRDRMAGSDLSGGVGARPAIHWGPLGSNWAQVAYRRGHVGPGRGNCDGCALKDLLRLCHGCCSPGHRHGNGLSDTARRYWRRCSSGVASRLRWCLSSLARSRLRDRSAHRWDFRRHSRCASGNRVDRRFDFRLGSCRCTANARDEAIDWRTVTDWHSYDPIANHYDRVWAPRFAAVAKEIWALTPSSPGQCILDVGTGTGI